MSKKSRVKEDVLPVELIHRIQSLLPLKEGGSTCILSKSWLHAWYTIPTLRIIPPEPDKLFSIFKNATNYNNFIRTTLLRYRRYNMPIESFHLRLNIRKNYLHLEDVKNWIRLVVSESCLKELSLDFRVFIKDSFTLPNELFSSQNLHTINVTNTIVEISGPLRICTNPPVINCVSLRVLDLIHVVISEAVFHNLLSACSLLEKIKLWCCRGLKNVKVKNLPRLSKLEILLTDKGEDVLREINNVPSLCSFRYRTIYAFEKPIPFQINSLASVTQLCLEGVSIDDSFFNTIESKFSVLECLTLGINYWKPANMAITSVSLKWLTLVLSQTWVNVQVNAPRLLSFIYTGFIPAGLIFRTKSPEQIKLTFNSHEPLRHWFFLKMIKTLNSLSKFDIYIGHDILDSVVPFNIDVDDLGRRVLFPVGNVQLTLETRLDEHMWKQSRFFDAFFLICHPSYIRSSYQVIRKMMEGNTTDLKQVLFKNPHGKKWEALTSSWISVLHTFPGYLDCKLIWFPQ